MSWPAEAVMVRVPATSANLGPGFDALGLALACYDEVTVRVTGSGLAIEVSGEGADTTTAGENHLVVRAMRAAFAAAGSQPPGLALRCVNRIPHSRGLGSSAAAIVAGVVAANALLTGAPPDAPPGAPHGGSASASPDDPAAAPPDARAGAPPAGPGAAPLDGVRPALTDDEVYALAAQIEGHPDNVAACLAGGLTIAWLEDSGPRLVQLSPLPQIMPVVCIAPGALATAQARKVLPETVSHADAATNAGRSALLVAAFTADPDVLLAATQDLLHQPYRAGVMPATADLVSRLRAAGIPAVVSGAGPSVLAFPPAHTSTDLGELGSIVKETGNAWHVSPLDVDRLGASVQFGPPDARSSHTPRKAWSGRGLGQARPSSAASHEPQGRSSSSATRTTFEGIRWPLVVLG